MVLGLFQRNNQATDGVDPKSLKMHPVLQNLQGNILKAHGRDEAYHLFLRFTKGPDKVKAWIREYAQDSHHVTSALKQLQDADKRKEAERQGGPAYTGGLFGCFFLSAAGYEELGFPTTQFESSFRHGMKHRENYSTNSGIKSINIENKDPKPEDWQVEYRGEIHALLILAQNRDDPGPYLKEKVELVKESLKGIAEVLIVEHGIRKVNHNGKDFEHFGYRDGISNPLFFESEITSKWRGRYDPSAPLDLVLAEDPLAGEANCYGSYLVFRKLRQDVEAFNRQVKELSGHANRGDVKLTGAQLVGRFKDGTPVTDYNSPQGSNADINNFNYKDNNDHNCPVHAHIRKANPRDGSERSRRIVRRGIPYGETGDAEVGLLFMCYQSNIHDQFEFIQRVWVDNPDHPEPQTGEDPLVGQDPVRSEESDSSKSGKTPPDFGGHVTLQGGEYFFAPSLSFLKNIHELTATEQQLTNNLTDLNGGQMSEDKFLVIATYNHKAYRILKDPNPNLDQTQFARGTAVDLFGARIIDKNGNLETKGELDTKYFTFVGAFPYLKILGADPDGEKKREEHLYGWVAIVSGEENLNELKAAMGWPNSRFCKVFNIEISRIIPIEGKSEEVEQDLKKCRDPEAWRQAGLDIYEKQTPAMWEG